MQRRAEICTGKCRSASYLARPRLQWMGRSFHQCLRCPQVSKHTRRLVVTLSHVGVNLLANLLLAPCCRKCLVLHQNICTAWNIHCAPSRAAVAVLSITSTHGCHQSYFPRFAGLQVPLCRPREAELLHDPAIHSIRDTFQARRLHKILQRHIAYRKIVSGADSDNPAHGGRPHSCWLEQCKTKPLQMSPQP